MNRLFNLFCLFTIFGLPTMAFAEGIISTKGVATLGAGLVVIGAAMGIGKLASAALEGIARQPEAKGALQTNMLIAAALIEGVALFCALICFLAK